MKTFTAKQLSRSPAQVFDAAREDGKAEITHDRFKGKFELNHIPEIEYYHKFTGEFSPWETNIKYKVGDIFYLNGYPKIITKLSDAALTYEEYKGDKKPAEAG